MISQMKRVRSPGPFFLLALALVGVFACEGQNPTAPQYGALVQMTVVASRSRVVPEMFEDAASRLLPSFSDETRATELRTRLKEFSSAYAAGNDVAARSALRSARVLLEKGGAHAANISALRLSIGLAEALIDSTATAEVSHD